MTVQKVPEIEKLREDLTRFNFDRIDEYLAFGNFVIERDADGKIKKEEKDNFETLTHKNGKYFGETNIATKKTNFEKR